MKTAVLNCKNVISHQRGIKRSSITAIHCKTRSSTFWDTKSDFTLRKLCGEGQLDDVVRYVEDGCQYGVAITRDTVYHLLRACVQKKDLSATRRAHHFMVITGLDSVSCLADNIVRSYSMCWHLTEAQCAFYMMPKPSVYSWNFIISAHLDMDRLAEAHVLYFRMLESNIVPDKVVFLTVLKLFSRERSVECGMLVHFQLTELDFNSDVEIQSALVVMYAKCHNVEEARSVFDFAGRIDEVILGTMITGYNDNEQADSAVELFDRIMCWGTTISQTLYSCMIKACTLSENIGQGMKIHHHIVENGLEPNVIVGSSLIDMYSKCGNLVDSRKIFDCMHTRNVVSWGSMIGGYVQHCDGLAGLRLFERLQHDGPEPDNVIFLFALKACESARDISSCRFIHDQIIRAGLASEKFISNALVEVYAMCGSFQEAQKIFNFHSSRAIESWNALISGCTVNGLANFAVELYEQMCEEAILPNCVTYINIIKTCGESEAVGKGREVHHEVVKTGIESENVIGSSLIHMYAKCGCLTEAHKLFDVLPNKDIVSWGVLMSAYAGEGYISHVCELYEEMHFKGIIPDRAVLLCMLKACGSTGLIRQGRLVHSQITESELESNVVIGNAVIDMYSKCGILDDAANVFQSLRQQDEVSWAAVLSGYVIHGRGREVGQFLDSMKEHGLKPMIAIFTSLLAACSHAGLYDDALIYFQYMIGLGIEPTIEHYSCLLDLFCRKGCLKEAENLLQSMPPDPDIVVWTSFLTSCRTYGEVLFGRHCFGQISQMDPSDASGHVLMCNLYTEAQMWGNTAKSCIEADNMLHEFVA